MKLKSPVFETYKTHDEVRCWKCGELCNYPPYQQGRLHGNFDQYCIYCDVFTRYDLEGFDYEW